VVHHLSIHQPQFWTRGKSVLIILPPRTFVGETLPSRGAFRADAGQNTDTPPWRFAMLLIMLTLMTTVFPRQRADGPPCPPSGGQKCNQSIYLNPCRQELGEVDCSDLRRLGQGDEWGR